MSWRLLQQSTATDPYLGQGISPQCHHSWTLTWSISSSPSYAHAATTPWTCGISPDFSLEAATPVLCPPDAKNCLIWKILMLGRNEGQGEWMREDEMVGWHWGFHVLEFQLALGVGDGQGILVCCSPWGFTQSDKTEQMKWTDCNRENALNASS